MVHYHAAHDVLEITNQGANCGDISGDLDMCSIEAEMSLSTHFTRPENICQMVIAFVNY